MLNNEELKKRGIHNHNVPKMTQKKLKLKRTNHILPYQD